MQMKVKYRLAAGGTTMHLEPVTRRLVFAIQIVLCFGCNLFQSKEFGFTNLKIVRKMALRDN